MQNNLEILSLRYNETANVIKTSLKISNFILFFLNREKVPKQINLQKENPFVLK